MVARLHRGSAMEKALATRDVFCAGVATGVLGAYVLYKALTLTAAQRVILLGALIGSRNQSSRTTSLDREIEFHFEDTETYFRHGRPPAVGQNLRNERLKWVQL